MSQLIGSILIGADQAVADLIALQLPGFAPEKFTAIGVVRSGRVVGGVAYHNFRQRNIEVTAAFDDPRWALPGTLRALFVYPFETLGCVRMTAVIGRKNKRSRRFCEGLGFRLEGVARRAFDGKQDAMIYGLLREECRFLGIGHGQATQHRAAAA